MAGYNIFLRHSVTKDLDGIPKRDPKRIIGRIRSLAHDPWPSGCEKLSGQERYRVRQGRYRIVYSVQDDNLTIWVVKVGHGRNVYRRLG